MFRLGGCVCASSRPGHARAGRPREGGAAAAARAAAGLRRLIRVWRRQSETLSQGASTVAAVHAAHGRLPAYGVGLQSALGVDMS